MLNVSLQRRAMRSIKITDEIISPRAILRQPG